MNSLLGRFCILTIILVLLSTFVSPVHGQSKLNITVKVPYKSTSYQGKPLVWDGADMMLLRRDGKISILPVSSSKDYSVVKQGFSSYSKSEMRVQLQKEFGSKYQVSVTSNFIVVHPPGDYGVWAMPFEELYARFRAYFQSRGLSVKDPEFPMVAVVLRTRNEFDRMLGAYHEYDRQILGYYNPRSNRIITYNQGNGKSSSKDWFFNSKTIIHEATHQTAFNTGIHSRYAPVPRWISEGLAMYFEAKGVNNSMYYSKQKDRINRSRLIELKAFFKRGKVKGKVAQLVVSDQLFRSDPNLAYALSWGLTFFLSEKMPDEYHAFLKKDGKRSDFQDFTARDRASDFGAAFGSDISSLEARMKQFITQLSVPSR